MPSTHVHVYTPANVATPLEKIILCHKYFRYIYQTNTKLFTIISAVRQSKFRRASTIINEVSIFGYVIHFSNGLVVQASRGINNMHKSTNSANAGTWKMKFGLFDRRDDSEHTVLVWSR